MIPEGMPVLGKGAHESPALGACAMEMVSLLAGEEWDDYPQCTNKDLARRVQYINDDCRDEDRHLLLPLLPRLIGTRGNTCEADTAVTDKVMGLETEEYRRVSKEFRPEESDRVWMEKMVEMLLRMCDAADEINGVDRSEHIEVDYVVLEQMRREKAGH